MAYTYALTGVGSPSTVLRSDGYEFPQDPSNAAYQTWLTFTAGGGSTTAAPTVSLAAARTAAKGAVEDVVGDARISYLGSRPGNSVFQALRFREAQDCAADGSPTEGEYPLLAAEIGTNGVNLAAVKTNVLAELATLKTNLVAIEVARADAYADIDAAADKPAVQAVLDALDVPTADTP